jgi:hypothetical protein
MAYSKRDHGCGVKFPGDVADAITTGRLVDTSKEDT